MTAALIIIDEDDPARIAALLSRHRGATASGRVVIEGRSYGPGDVEALAGLDRQGATRGSLTFAMEDGLCRLVTLISDDPRDGAGTALVAHLMVLARSRGAAKLRVTVTNDQTEALRFFQKRGARMVAAFPGAVTAARAAFPDLPEKGVDGLPIRDEIALEWTL